MVPPAAVLQAAAAGQPQPQLLAGDAGRRAVRAAGSDLDSLRFPGQRAGLPAIADRTDAAVGGAATGDRTAVGGGVVEHPRSGLPLGAGHRPGDAGAGLLAGLAPGCGLDPRQLPVGTAAAGIRPADGGVAAADAGHWRAGTAGRSVRLGVVQHGQGLCCRARQRRAGCRRPGPPSFPFHRAGRPPWRAAVAGRGPAAGRAPACAGAGADLGRPVLGGRAGRRWPSFPSLPGCPPASIRHVPWPEPFAGTPS